MRIRTSGFWNVRPKGTWVSLLIVGFVYLAGPAWGQIPPGFEVIQISDDPDYDGPPAINNCGQIVFSKRINQGFDTEEIFLYDPSNGGQVIRITDDNVRDAFPDINDLGTIVWSRAKAPGELENFEIAMWKDGQITILTDNDVGDWSPQVNNLDHITWFQVSNQGCSGAEILFHDGQGIQQITSNGLSNQSPALNDLDEIAWTSYDFCVSPWMATIMLYSGGKITELSDGLGQDQGTTINNRTQVAWGTGYPDPGGIALWEAGITQQVTESGGGPWMNNLSHITFHRWHDGTSTYEQWLYREGEFFQLSDEPARNVDGEINDLGEVAWQFGFFPSIDIRLLRVVPGDADHDGVIGLGDFSVLAECLTGPTLLEEPCLGTTIDSDQDGDVDIRDFGALQISFNEETDYEVFAECFTGPRREVDLCSCRIVDLDGDWDIDLRDFALFQSLFEQGS